MAMFNKGQGLIGISHKMLKPCEILQKQVCEVMEHYNSRCSTEVIWCCRKQASIKLIVLCLEYYALIV